MILSSGECDTIMQVREKNPHHLLGMHLFHKTDPSLKLSNRKKSEPIIQTGVVVRAMLANATKVEVVPVHDKGKPSFPLVQLHPSGLFEGSVLGCDEVYAYDLVITDFQGRVRRTRDPYSFLPSVDNQSEFLFAKGDERRLFDKLGAHIREYDGVKGVAFAVWAPNARRVSVVGDFNGWDGRYYPMRSLGVSGIWEIFVPGLDAGIRYKYELHDCNGALRLKTDPMGFEFEIAPRTASIVCDIEGYEWADRDWMESRVGRNWLAEPISIYEVHIGSWMKKSAFASFNYRELAPLLIEHVKKMGFTHVEFLPIAEHAYYPSWGYQVTGYYAPTSRYGSPRDFMYLVDQLHQAQIGVIVDWVPAHFPMDDFALARFDGTALYEHADPRQGYHQDWGTYIFNYGRNEVKNFLTANALFWLEKYHVDGLRVDAVASILYLDYSRKHGEWVPNKYGGRENLEAIEFLQHFNHLAHTEYPGVITIAEESTAWPQVTRPPYMGGLGFDFKWNMGWMHDTLAYFQKEPIHRKFHHNNLTFGMLYHYHENFILPFSHDEVVHGKGSLMQKMPGDDWQKAANLRSLLAWHWLYPGKKLLFMGCEFGPRSEWNENESLPWHILEQGPYHCGIQRLVADLNQIYRVESPLWHSDYRVGGFQWIDCSDYHQSTYSFFREGQKSDDVVLVVMNLTPIPRYGYRIGLPRNGKWIEILNSDAEVYAGSNAGNGGGIQSEPIEYHGQPWSALLTLPPLGVCVFKYKGKHI
jgi:1,4-alpha-glucan branching enzyme